MARKTFSEKEKEAAVNMLASGNLTNKLVAKKVGCSIATLQLWKKKYSPTGQDDWQDDEWDEEETDAVEEEMAEQCEDCCCAAKKGDAHDVMRKFWNKNYRAVDMLLSPREVSSEEVVKLVNEALQYAYDHS